MEKRKSSNFRPAALVAATFVALSASALLWQTMPRRIHSFFTSNYGLGSDFSREYWTALNWWPRRFRYHSWSGGRPQCTVNLEACRIGQTWLAWREWSLPEGLRLGAACARMRLETFEVEANADNKQIDPE